MFLISTELIAKCRTLFHLLLGTTHRVNNNRVQWICNLVCFNQLPTLPPSQKKQDMSWRNSTSLIFCWFIGSVVKLKNQFGFTLNKLFLSLFTPCRNFSNFCLKMTISVNSVSGIQCKSMAISVFTHADSTSVLDKLILSQTHVF